MKKLIAATLLAAAPFTCFAAPFTDAVANDYYSLSHGGTANGIPTANDHNDSAPDLYQAVNTLLGTSYTHNYQLDDRFVAADELFVGTGNHSVVLVGLAAKNVNSLGIYTDAGVGNNKTPAFGGQSGFYMTGNGSPLQPFIASQMEISGTFGWYLQSKQWNTQQTLTFYSESALNTGDNGLDRMMTFTLDELNGKTYSLVDDSGVYDYTFENALLIGWEDMPFSNGKLGDEDYDDIMYLIDFRSTSEVPEPWTMALSALVAGGLLSARRRRV